MSEQHLPHPTAYSKAFWDSCREERLTAPRCRDCGHLHFPPRPACPKCLSPDVDWEESQGKGQVYSFTVIHRPPSPAFAAPYAVALVQLDEGWKTGATIIDCDPADVRIGMRVQVRFRRMSDAITLPFFAPEATS